MQPGQSVQSQNTAAGGHDSEERQADAVPQLEPLCALQPEAL